MKIVYRGGFLVEGFQRLGHEVIPLVLCDGSSLEEQVRAVCPCPDMVFLEFMADTALPDDLGDCPFPLAGYFVDAPINAFWQAPLSRVFDYAFVDQLPAVAAFQARQATVHWLPLCVPARAFRESGPKEHFLAFVGTINSYRHKRKNLLRHIAARFPVTSRSGLSFDEMMDLFSRSSVVLNENLFDGLTLRLLQGMASGSLVVTERPSTGSERYFSHGEHLAYYDSGTVLDLLSDIRDNPGPWAEVARKGRQECERRHTSEKRAAEALAVIEKTAGRPRLDKTKARLAQAEATCLLRLRFGGSIKAPYAVLQRHSESSDKETRAKAGLLLAGVLARKGMPDQAAALLDDIGHESPNERSLLLSAMILVHRQREEEALRLLQTALPLFPGTFEILAPALETLAVAERGNAFTADLLLLISQCYYLAGRVMDLGFAKTVEDSYPENAFETAVMAWKKCPSPAILDFLLRCGKENKVEGELLPYLLEAIESGAATDEQIVFAAETAERYYDKELAKTIAKELHNSIRRATGKKPVRP